MHVSEETQQVRTLAREFAEAELRPNVERWDSERILDPGVVEHLAELGFFGMLVPEAFGGMAFDPGTYAAVLEELAWGEPAVALVVSVHGAHAIVPLLERGTDAQRRRWLEPLARGDLVASASLAAGAAEDATEVVATRAGEGWTLNGTLRWVANPRLAGVVAVTAAIDDGVGTFLVPSDAPGFEVGERETTLGLRPLALSAVELRDLQLDGDALLGEPSRGPDPRIAGGDQARLGIAAIATGIGQAALEHAIRYAAEREQFGKRIREFEGIQFKLAEMATRIEAARALTRHAATAPSALSTAVAKLFAGESAMWIATQAVQVFGGYGYMRDYPVEKLMRDAKATEIFEGTNEIQRVRIARELYRS